MKKIAADTNVLIRAVVGDDAVQAKQAAQVLTSAKLVAVSLPVFCEFVWVLLRLYRLTREDVATAIRTLLVTSNVELNRPAVEAGLALLEAGGDFADGVIAYEGRWLGGETLVTFDKKAANLLTVQGHAVRLL